MTFLLFVQALQHITVDKLNVYALKTTTLVIPGHGPH